MIPTSPPAQPLHYPHLIVYVSVLGGVTMFSTRSLRNIGYNVGYIRPGRRDIVVDNIYHVIGDLTTLIRQAEAA